MGLIMQVIGDAKSGLTISDGIETLTLSISKIDWMTFGTLRTVDGREWAHNSIGAINLLILHAHDAVTVSELVKDLGPCDSVRISI